MNLNICDDYFGCLLPYIRDDSITDITWNGRALWIDHLEKGRYREKLALDDHFINTLAARISNMVNKSFNASQPVLEAETDSLRISFIHGSVTNTGISVAIRKTPVVRRLSEEIMLESQYADELMIELLRCLVLGHCSIIVVGDVGSGKTELVKYLTKFIPDSERTISIEDNFELRLSAINPKLDCVELRASEGFDYGKCIKSSLRQLCKWLLLSEARSREVSSLLEAGSTGCICLTTLHSDDVRKIPDRIQNMIGRDGAEKANDIYNFFNIGIKLMVEKDNTGIKRRIEQLCAFDRVDDVNSITMIFDEGRFTGKNFPKNIRKKLNESKVDNPLDRVFGKEMGK
ncbi:MAG: ATPase, T2SS/T4P/T4SS family [Eubacteriaceae bacterium]|nr:ATPase, T2SS/T4P/T4SS family [Eubacteriaceae bacterium]